MNPETAIKLESLESRIAPASAATLFVAAQDVPDAEQSNIGGSETGSFTGAAIESVGDFNGDGFADFLMSEPRMGGDLVGELHLVLGTGSGIPNIDVSSLDGSNGTTIVGAVVGGKMGESVGSGDFNGDNLSDVLFAVPGNSGQAGSAYVLFGTVDPLSAQTPLSAATEIAGSTALGRVQGIGEGVAGISDFNADGLDDFVLSGNIDTDQGLKAGGLVMFGRTGVWATSVSQPTGPAEGGYFVLESSEAHNTWPSGLTQPGRNSVVAGLGDFNGDGFDDFIFGAPLSSFGDSGSVALFLGGADPFVVGDVVSPDQQIDNQPYYGAGVGAAGDFNNDGFADAMFSSARENSVFVALGNASGTFGQDITISGTDGMAIGNGPGTLTGGVDFNEDGFDDLAIGMGGGTGGALILFGGTSDMLADTYIAGEVTPGHGLALTTDAPGNVVVSKVSAADFDGDGVGDLAIAPISPDLGSGQSTIFDGGDDAVAFTDNAYFNLLSNGKVATTLLPNGSIAEVKTTSGLFSEANSPDGSAELQLERSGGAYVITTLDVTAAPFNNGNLTINSSVAPGVVLADSLASVKSSHALADIDANNITTLSAPDVAGTATIDSIARLIVNNLSGDLTTLGDITVTAKQNITGTIDAENITLKTGAIQGATIDGADVNIEANSVVSSTINAEGLAMEVSGNISSTDISATRIERLKAAGLVGGTERSTIVADAIEDILLTNLSGTDISVSGDIASVVIRNNTSTTTIDAEGTIGSFETASISGTEDFPTLIEADSFLSPVIIGDASFVIGDTPLVPAPNVTIQRG